MSDWFKTENYGRWLGNLFVAAAVALLVTLLAFVFPVSASWGTLVALLAVFGVPLLARVAPPWLNKYVGHWKAGERAAKARLIELTAVVLVYVLFSLVVW